MQQTTQRVLNIRERKFVELYVASYLSDTPLNATALARKADYAPDSAKVTASRLLTRANVRAAIDAGIAERSKNGRISEAMIRSQYAKIALNDSGNESTTNQLHALDSLARTKAMFSERQIVAIETPTLSPAEVLRYREISAALDRPALAAPNIPADVLDGEVTETVNKAGVLDAEATDSEQPATNPTDKEHAPAHTRVANPMPSETTE